MLTYAMVNRGNASLYEYLYQCIRDDIQNGNLQPGEKLPSKRAFAENLGISVITVENAYAQLVAEGYVTAEAKRGFYVSGANQQQNLKVQRTTQRKSQERGLLADFVSNQTRSENFPFSIWSKLIRELLSGSQADLLTNAPCAGIFPLRQAIAKHLRDFRGMNVKPEQIVIGAGTEYLYGLLMQLLGSDKVYAVEDPGYQKLYRIYESHGVKCELIPMDESGIQIEALEGKQVQVAHVTPSHHYPTGLTMPISRRYELLAWVSQKPGRYILEDDYDSEFRLTGQAIPPLQLIDMQNRVIYLNTFTKTLASTVRISYMVLPETLAEEFAERFSFYSCTVSNFEQYTLAHFIERGFFEKHINRMRNDYRSRRDQLLQCIRESELADAVTIAEEDAGLHFLMTIQTALSDQDFCEAALEQGIRMNPLSAFYHQGTSLPEHQFVMNYSSLPESAMVETVKRLAQIAKK